ncbi:MAG: DNA mismatch repair protein MutS [FCB group bacterium]|nr:DNA mismatch repair protein MutS [FCB group bacterium]
MKQFREAKKGHPGTLMLFRMGDFYETFENDAVIASSVLGITLTKRANGAASSIPLAGFPYHALDQHLYKLLKAGHRVAICEQVEDPKLAKGIVKREVVEVVTPGTALSDKYLDQRENNFLASLIFGKDRFGLALLDHSTGEFMAGEWPADVLPNILNQYDPSEIILPESQESRFKSNPGFKKYFYTKYPDWQGDYSTAYENLTEHFKTANLKGFGIDELPLAVAAAGAGYAYVHQNFKGRTQHITSISHLQDGNTMGVDAFTLRNLEVFKSLSSQGTHGTLISVLDKTMTAMGSRLLKKWLCRPPAESKQIQQRLDRIEELVNEPEMASDLRKKLKETVDIDRVIAKLSTRRSTPRDILQLGKTLKLLQELKLIFSTGESAITDLLIRMRDVSAVWERILTTIQPEPPVNPSKGGYIAPGFSEELDQYRKLSKNASDWLVKYQLEEQKKTGIGSLKVGYNKVFGYFIEVTKTHTARVPDDYIRKQTLVNAERYFTPELKEYEEKILNADDKIRQLESRYFQELGDFILKKAQDIQFNSHILARLDVAAALAFVALQNDYTRPQISVGNELILKNSRHPVVEKLLPPGTQFIPNDLTLDCSDKQIGIITGPNMAGKSTFLRQVGLIVLMAQTGSFVPAESAQIGVVDKLFTRVGASDNLAGGESTFLVEMNETANILNNATPSSLILLDEIGRGTSTYDGLSIAWAVVEYLHNNQKIAAKTLFATHYHELLELADQLPRAFNLNVAVKEFGNRVIFLRKIISGGADKSYGVHVAEMAGLPKSVIKRAHTILGKLTRKEDQHPAAELEVQHSFQVDLFEKQEMELRDDLDKLDVNQLTPLEALMKIDELKKKHGL